MKGAGERRDMGEGLAIDGGVLLGKGGIMGENLLERKAFVCDRLGLIVCVCVWGVGGWEGSGSPPPGWRMGEKTAEGKALLLLLGWTGP